MNKVFKYSIALFGIFWAINLGANIFSTTIIEVFHPPLLARILFVFVESIASALILTLISINSFPVIRELLITVRRLLRFDNLSHPLLIKLSQEAPSTYHHSIMVANIAYRGAKAIGANPILARVGAYYHDIGKLIRPEYFAENQNSDHGLPQNIHDSLKPLESAKVIINHVKEGIRLAKEYNLPPEVVNFIPQHHGTQVAQFFYRKAKAAGYNNRKNDFRYPGPKPLSKETAIVMLADSIESKVRSMPNPQSNHINQAIDEVITEKLDDDQLELSGLTARDLAKLRHTFAEIIITMTHRRMKYPGQR